MDFLQLSILIPILLIVSFCDFRWHIIPNYITLPVIGVGFVVNSLISGIDGFLSALSGFGIAAILFLVLYLLKAMGAGDVKLIAGIGALIGGEKIVPALFYIIIAGGLMAILQMGIVFWQNYSYLNLNTPKVRENESTMRSALKKTIPYGVAISAGTIASFLL